MISSYLLIFTLISIWASLTINLIPLIGAVHFWLRQSRRLTQLVPLRRYPKITLVVPAHNEALVIKATVQALFNLHYPADKLEFLLYADNCTDDTYSIMHTLASQPQFSHLAITVINRKGGGGKAGVLNDALKQATGEYIGVYDADAIPERYALYFLVQQVLRHPNRYIAAFGRNKTRNAQQNFLTKCINQEIVVTQRIQHVGNWNLFGIGRIPGTNFIINTAFIRSLGGWQNGALTEDTDISFKILAAGKQIALAHNSEAFQQEPETLSSYYWQRMRWAKGNYQVVFANLRHLFDRSNWRVKLEVFYYSATFLWFNLAIILSDIMFFANVGSWIIHFFNPELSLPFTLGANSVYLMQLLLFNWLMMIILYMLQITIAQATQYGQSAPMQIFISLISYFTYAQLFIVVSLHALTSLIIDRCRHRTTTKWVKTRRFSD